MEDTWNALIGAHCEQQGSLYQVWFVLPLPIEIDGEKRGLKVTVRGIGSDFHSTVVEEIPIPKNPLQD